jgi:hypothetical protein
MFFSFLFFSFLFFFGEISHCCDFFIKKVNDFWIFKKIKYFLEKWPNVQGGSQE